MWHNVMRALLPLIIVTHALVPPPRTRLRRIVAPRANPFDEILDALDSMFGVSPLSEADMKSGLSSEEREENRDAWFLERVGGRRVLGLRRGAGRELLVRQTALHVGFGERAHADHGVERV